MPIFIAALIGGLVQAAGTLAGRVLLALGFGVVEYQGLSTGLSWLTDFMWTSMDALPPAAIQTLSALKVGTCISILLSALTMRLMLRGLTSGKLVKMVQR